MPTGAAAARDAELAKVAAGLLDAFMNTGPVLSRDGKKVIFNSNRDGLPQLYVADAAKPDAPATRLVATKERMVEPRTTKDGKSVLFKSDKGADENWDFFRVDLDGKNLAQLTSGDPLNRDMALVPDGKPDTLFSRRARCRKLRPPFTCSRFNLELPQRKHSPRADSAF